jgi:hypothetical protein
MISGANVLSEGDKYQVVESTFVRLLSSKGDFIKPELSPFFQIFDSEYRSIETPFDLAPGDGLVTQVRTGGTLIADYTITPMISLSGYHEVRL